jgi:hypothetical protein
MTTSNASHTRRQVHSAASAALAVGFWLWCRVPSQPCRPRSMHRSSEQPAAAAFAAAAAAAATPFKAPILRKCALQGCARPIHIGGQRSVVRGSAAPSNSADLLLGRVFRCAGPMQCGAGRGARPFERCAARELSEATSAGGRRRRRPQSWCANCELGPAVCSVQCAVRTRTRQNVSSTVRGADQRGTSARTHAVLQPPLGRSQGPAGGACCVLRAGSSR